MKTKKGIRTEYSYKDIEAKRRKALALARDLYYDSHCKEAIKNARNEYEIDAALYGARHRK